MSLLAYPCGSTITTKLGKLEGMITGVIIRFDKIMYEVTILIGGEPKTFTYYEAEFDTEFKKQSIGYKS